MTMTTVYIGDINDPSFDWDGADGIPKNLNRDFPPDGNSYLGYFHRWIEKSGVECKLTWYEVWVAIVTKNQINDYIEYCYGSDPSYNDPNIWLPHLVDRLDSVKVFVSELNSHEQYALVAMEVY